MARSSGYKYDPSTGQWVRGINVTGSVPTDDGGSSSNKSSGGDNLTSSTSDKNNSAGSVEKKYNEIEINTLTGTLNFIVTEETIKLRAGDTVKIQGIGKYLSGNYYVQDITRQISSNGYSHSATLIRTDFGNSLKMHTSSSSKKSEKSVSSSSQASDAKRTYTVKTGDCLWNISKKFYGAGKEWGTIYDANTNQIVDPDLIYPGQELVIP